MARPKKVGLDYFPHDCDASGDEKLEPIEALFGNDGYAVYFKLLERVYRAGGALDFSDPDTAITLAKKCNLTHEKFTEILEKCLDKNLFDRAKYVRKKCLTSDGILKRITPITGKRLKWRRKKTGENLDNGEVFSGENPPETPQSKVNKRKENKTKGNKSIYGEFENVFLTDAEHGKLVERFTEKGASDRIENLSRYIASKGKRYVDHYATILTWESKDNKKGASNGQSGISGAHKPHNQDARTKAGGVAVASDHFAGVTIRFDDDPDGDTAGEVT